MIQWQHQVNKGRIIVNTNATRALDKTPMAQGFKFMIHDTWQVDYPGGHIIVPINSTS